MNVRRIYRFVKCSCKIRFNLLLKFPLWNIATVNETFKGLLYISVFEELDPHFLFTFLMIREIKKQKETKVKIFYNSNVNKQD